MDKDKVERPLMEGIAQMAFLGLVTAAISYRWAQTEYAREHARAKRKAILRAWLSDIAWQAKKADRNAMLLARWLASTSAESELKATATEAVTLWTTTRTAWAAAKATGWKDKGLMAALRQSEGDLFLFLTNTKKHGIIGIGGEIPPETDGT